jgi:hypothetical protein
MRDALRDPWRLALGAILIAALWLRLGSIGFGLPALNDPDELMFELGAIRMLRGPTLNPGWFGHPATTTMYVLALVDVATFAAGWTVGRLSSVQGFADAIYADPSWVILPGRIAMALFALGTIFLTWRLAHRLADRRVASIAAVLLAVSPLHVAYSQIIRSDMMACFFMLLCLHAALDLAENGRWSDTLRAAFWLGVAVATKWPFALAAVAVFAALALRVSGGLSTWRAALWRFIAFGLLACLCLCLVSPYLLIDYPTVLRNLGGEGQLRHLGSTGGSFLFNARWYLTGPLWAGLGATGLILMCAGAVALWSQKQAFALLVPLGLCYFALLCSQSMVWDRWALPLLPIGAILAAGALRALGDGVGGRAGIALTILVLVCAVPPLLLRDRADAHERMNDTRQIAARWARTHIPRGSTVLIEHFAFDLVDQPWRFLFPLGDAGCVDARAALRGKIAYAPVDRARGMRANVDYGTLAPTKRDSCRADYAILTQYDRYRQEKGAFPAEYAAYRDLIAQGRIVARFVPDTGVSGGRIVTIVAFDRRPGALR